MCAGETQSIHIYYTGVVGKGYKRNKGRKFYEEAWEAGEKGE